MHAASFISIGNYEGFAGLNPISIKLNGRSFTSTDGYFCTFDTTSSSPSISTMVNATVLSESALLCSVSWQYPAAIVVVGLKARVGLVSRPSRPQYFNFKGQ